MKGITPIIAVILLLLITVSMAGFAFVFLQRSLESATTASGDQIQQQARQAGEQVRIESVSGNKIYVRNTGTGAIQNTSFGFTVNNKQVDFNFTSGINKSEIKEIGFVPPTCKDMLPGVRIRVVADAVSDLYTITESPSGMYRIKPDSFVVDTYCNMDLDGGGWTRVWLPGPSENIPTGGTNYTGGTGTLVANSSEIMVAYTDSSNTLTQAWKFNTPAYWKALHPFNISCGSDNITATRINDSLQVTDTLIYGTGSFGSYCSDACGGTWGRTCLRRNGFNGAYDFPFYATYSISSGTDHCSNSDQGYSSTACSANRLFVIYAR